jgi:hypothetical protein
MVGVLVQTQQTERRRWTTDRTFAASARKKELLKCITRTKGLIIKLLRRERDECNELPKSRITTTRGLGQQLKCTEEFVNTVTDQMIKNELLVERIDWSGEPCVFAVYKDQDKAITYVGAKEAFHLNYKNKSVPYSCRSAILSSKERLQQLDESLCIEDIKSKEQAQAHMLPGVVVERVVGLMHNAFEIGYRDENLEDKPKVYVLNEEKIKENGRRWHIKNNKKSIKDKKNKELLEKLEACAIKEKKRLKVRDFIISKVYKYPFSCIINHVKMAKQCGCAKLLVYKVIKQMYEAKLISYCSEQSLTEPMVGRDVIIVKYDQKLECLHRNFPAQESEERVALVDAWTDKIKSIKERYAKIDIYRTDKPTPPYICTAMSIMGCLTNKKVRMRAYFKKTKRDIFLRAIKYLEEEKGIKLSVCRDKKITGMAAPLVIPYKELLDPLLHSKEEVATYWTKVVDAMGLKNRGHRRGVTPKPSKPSREEIRDSIIRNSHFLHGNKKTNSLPVLSVDNSVDNSSLSTEKAKIFSQKKCAQPQSTETEFLLAKPTKQPFSPLEAIYYSILKLDTTYLDLIYCNKVYLLNKFNKQTFCQPPPMIGLLKNQQPCGSPQSESLQTQTDLRRVNGVVSNINRKLLTPLGTTNENIPSLRNGANRGDNQFASIGINNENGGSHDRCKDQIRPEIQDGIFSGPGGTVTTARSRTGDSKLAALGSNRPPSKSPPNPPRGFVPHVMEAVSNMLFAKGFVGDRYVAKMVEIFGEERSRYYMDVYERQRFERLKAKKIRDAVRDDRK